MHLQNIFRNTISIANLVAVICILYYIDKQNLGVFFGVSALIDNNVFHIFLFRWFFSIMVFSFLKVFFYDLFCLQYLNQRMLILYGQVPR